MFGLTEAQLKIIMDIANGVPVERRSVFRERTAAMLRMRGYGHDLATIQKDGAIIKKHCTATSDEIQTAIRAHKQEHRDAEALVLGMTFGYAEQIRKAKAALRRLSI